MSGEILNSVCVSSVLDICGGAALALGASAGLLYLSVLSGLYSKRCYFLTTWSLIVLTQILVTILSAYAGWVATVSFWVGYGFLVVFPFLSRFDVWVSMRTTLTHIMAFVLVTITSILFLCYQFGYYSTLTSTH